MQTTSVQLPTFAEVMKSTNGPYYTYSGDRESWLVGYITQRDASLENESNWEAIQKRLRRCKGWEIERFRHWLVGWVDYLLVRPGSRAAQIAAECVQAIQDYPILDESDYSRREWRQWTELHVDHRRYGRDEECPFCQREAERRARRRAQK